MEYRILTDGKHFRAQIRVRFLIFKYWSTLMRHGSETSSVITYKTYELAKDDVLNYIDELKRKKNWKPV